MSEFNRLSFSKSVKHMYVNIAVVKIFWKFVNFSQPFVNGRKLIWLYLADILETIFLLLFPFLNINSVVIFKCIKQFILLDPSKEYVDFELKFFVYFLFPRWNWKYLEHWKM